MTRKIFVLLFVAAFAGKALAQVAPADTAGTANVKSIEQLSDAQLADWKSVEKIWYNNEYDKIKDENKVTLNCKTCQGFYADVVFKVNASGKLEYYKLISGNNCGRPFTKAQEVRMMRMFFKFEYPMSLRNTAFKARLGTKLKC